MNDPMGETGFSGESATETEIAAAEQLMQLSEEETTVSCSSSTGGDDGGRERGGKRRHEDACARIGIEQNKIKEKKKKKFRSLESIYLATKEIIRD